jgi:hypothetical protein
VTTHTHQRSPRQRASGRIHPTAGGVGGMCLRRSVRVRGSLSCVGRCARCRCSAHAGGNASSCIRGRIAQEDLVVASVGVCGVEHEPCARDTVTLQSATAVHEVTCRDELMSVSTICSEAL